MAEEDSLRPLAIGPLTTFAAQSSRPQSPFRDLRHSDTLRTMSNLPTAAVVASGIAIQYPTHNVASTTVSGLKEEPRAPESLQGAESKSQQQQQLSLVETLLDLLIALPPLLDANNPPLSDDTLQLLFIHPTATDGVAVGRKTWLTIFSMTPVNIEWEAGLDCRGPNGWDT
ncbi:hypothetical protein ACHAO9_011759 [Fusarium lateritium]